jgi:hypothetical protein
MRPCQHGNRYRQLDLRLALDLQKRSTNRVRMREVRGRLWLSFWRGAWTTGGKHAPACLTTANEGWLPRNRGSSSECDAVCVGRKTRSAGVFWEVVAGARSRLIVRRSSTSPISIAAKCGGKKSQPAVAGDSADAGQSANRAKRAAMALPAVRARALGGISSATLRRCLRISMTARAGRAAADEQERNLSSSLRLGWCRFSSQISRAPDCTALHRKKPGSSSLELRTATTGRISLLSRCFHRQHLFLLLM